MKNLLFLFGLFVFVVQSAKAAALDEQLGLLPHDIDLEVISEQPAFAIRELKKYHKGAACRGLAGGVVRLLRDIDENNVAIRYLPNPFRPTKLLTVQCPISAVERLPKSVWHEARLQWTFAKISVRNKIVKLVEMLDQHLNPPKVEMPRIDGK